MKRIGLIVLAVVVVVGLGGGCGERPLCDRAVPGVNMKQADLRSCDLRSKDMRGANFSGDSS